MTHEIPFNCKGCKKDYLCEVVDATVITTNDAFIDISFIDLKTGTVIYVLEFTRGDLWSYRGLPAYYDIEQSLNQREPSEWRDAICFACKTKLFTYSDLLKLMPFYKLGGYEGLCCFFRKFI